VLRRVDYLSMPWRNGLGTTLEIARQPAAPAAFRWRLSLASISCSGPFSSYAGYRRMVALIEGAGFQLDIDDERKVPLLARGQSAQFSGNAATVCTLIGGACTDLSLMVQEPGEIVSVTLERAERELHFATPPGMLQGFFVLSDGARLTWQNQTWQLQRHDALLTSAHDPAHPIQIAACAETLRMLWRP
jgi:environmental stress-induced protein Ves